MISTSIPQESSLAPEVFAELKQKVHNLLICPITGKIFKEPVVIKIDVKKEEETKGETKFLTVDKSALSSHSGDSKANQPSCQTLKYEGRHCANLVISSLIARLYKGGFEIEHQENDQIKFKSVLESELRCPILYSVYTNPVIFDNGQTCDRLVLDIQTSRTLRTPRIPRRNAHPMYPQISFDLCYENTLILELTKIFLEYWPEFQDDLIQNVLDTYPAPRFQRNQIQDRPLEANSCSASLAFCWFSTCMIGGAGWGAFFGWLSGNPDHAHENDAYNVGLGVAIGVTAGFLFAFAVCSLLTPVAPCRAVSRCCSRLFHWRAGGQPEERMAQPLLPPV